MPLLLNKHTFPAKFMLVVLAPITCVPYAFWPWTSSLKNCPTQKSMFPAVAATTGVPYVSSLMKKFPGENLLLLLSLCYSIVYCYNDAQRYEQFLQVGRLYRALILLGLAGCLPSASVSSVFVVQLVLYWYKHLFCLHPCLLICVNCAWWDWPLTWLTKHCAVTLLVGLHDP